MLECLETKKTGTLKQREQLHSALQNNRKIYEKVCTWQNLMEQTEQEYIWVHSLAGHGSRDTEWKAEDRT